MAEQRVTVEPAMIPACSGFAIPAELVIPAGCRLPSHITLTVRTEAGRELRLTWPVLTVEREHD